MSLGAANIRREPRPLRAHAGKMQARRIDKPHGVADPAFKSSRRHAQHMREEAGEDFVAAIVVGVGQGGAARDLAADMIKPRPMALKRGADVAQRNCSGELTVEQRDELLARGQFAHQAVAPMPLHEPLEDGPGNEFHNVRKKQYSYGAWRRSFFVSG